MPLSNTSGSPSLDDGPGLAGSGSITEDAADVLLSGIGGVGGARVYRQEVDGQMPQERESAAGSLQPSLARPSSATYYSSTPSFSNLNSEDFLHPESGSSRYSFVRSTRRWSGVSTPPVPVFKRPVMPVHQQATGITRFNQTGSTTEKTVNLEDVHVVLGDESQSPQQHIACSCEEKLEQYQVRE